MAKMYWVVIPQHTTKWVNVFVGTRITKAAAVKLAESELLSNRWNGHEARVFEATFDSYGNPKSIARFEVNRIGKATRSSEFGWADYGTKGLVWKMRRQFTIDDHGNLVKRDIEPKIYSVVEL